MKYYSRGKIAAKIINPPIKIDISNSDYNHMKGIIKSGVTMPIYECLLTVTDFTFDPVNERIKII